MSKTTEHSENRDYSGRVVAGTDGTATAEGAIDWAARYASRHGKSLVVLAAYPGADAPPSRVQRELVEVSAQRVRDADPELEVEAVIAKGDPSDALAAASSTADLVVVGARGESAPRRVRALGGVADGTVTHAHGPVLIVPEGAQVEHPGPVVVGVDGSRESAAAVALAAAEASLSGAELVAVHVWTSTTWLSDDVVPHIPEEASVRRFVEPLLTDYPDLAVEYVVKPGHPAGELVERSKTARLVVMGSRGRGGFAGLLLGSVSRGVLRDAQSPVLVTRGARD
ncbi:MAG TPA: universal stress protein [Actinomycetaceae bacterium]|nr:universal stress protein [Actinomycetaceae bacterium]